MDTVGTNATGNSVDVHKVRWGAQWAQIGHKFGTNTNGNSVDVHKVRWGAQWEKIGTNVNGNSVDVLPPFLCPQLLFLCPPLFFVPTVFVPDVIGT